MKLVKFALLLVVFLDVMNQGLVLPLMNTILLDPGQGILSKDTSSSERQLYYGIVMGAFFLSWFLGAAYISKLSDFMGRKQGILICLAGALIGYALTIVALVTNSFALLLIGRIISGFTSGNQPIAQAALVDMSESEEQKTRYMGLVLVALSLGLVAGPLISGVLSDPAALGGYASLELPFYVACALVIINIILILFYFHNHHAFKRRVFKIKVSEVFLTLWVASKRPIVRKLSLVFFFAQIGLNGFWVFLDTYLLERFHFDTLQNSIAIMVLGAGMAFSSAFLVAPANKRFHRKSIIVVCLIIMAISGVAYILNPIPFLAYVLIIPLIVAFGIYYPTMLTLFSASVDGSEQGWVMGVTVALYTLGTGLIALLGGWLLSINLHLPFAVAVGCSVLAVVLVYALWHGEDFKKLETQQQ